MGELLSELLGALDAIAASHGEVCDSECRERMSDPIFFMFIKPESGYEMPEDFGLRDTEGNGLVKAAITQYITSAIHASAEAGLETFHDRLAAFQNEDVQSNRDGTFFDDYFGWWNPDHFDSMGNIKANS